MATEDGRSRAVRAPRRSRRMSRTQLGGESLETRNLLTAVALQSWTANGATELTLQYYLEESEPAFNVGFYRSADAIFGSDTLLDTVTINESADLSPGLHQKTFAIGSAANQVALPGAGATEIADDYRLLAVANPTLAGLSSVVPFIGMYHAPANRVYVHGSDAADSVTITSTYQVSLQGVTRTYTAADVTGFRVRTHGGADNIDGTTAAKTIWAHGGAENDTLRGGTAADSLYGGVGIDSLTGGRGNDMLEGGEDSDTYQLSGTVDGTDVLKDAGTFGTDRIVATAAGTTMSLGATFSAVTGIDSISSNGFANFKLLGTSGTNTINLAGISLSGVTVIDVAGGADTVTGTANDDIIRGGIGNDIIDGGLGRDVALFAGLAASYSIVQSGGSVQVTDLATTVNGNDGMDTLSNVEVLRFTDKDILLSELLNATPIAVPDTMSIAEDGGPVVVPVLANDTDADAGDTKRVISVNSAGVRGIVQIPSGGTGILFYPNNSYGYLSAGEVAVETISYTMADTVGAQSTTTLTVTVIGANDTPRALADAATVSAASSGTTIHVLANDTDVDVNDTRTVISVDGSEIPETWELVIIYGVGAPLRIPGVPAVKGTIGVAPDGQGVTYSPGTAFRSLRAGQTAADQFRYTISDSASSLASSWVNITVVGENDAPTAVADSRLIAKNAAPIAIGVLANDFDFDLGDTKSIQSIDTSTLRGSATISADGQNVVYDVGDAFSDLLPGETGSDRFSYTMVDASGSTSTAIVQITIRGENSTPVAVADSGLTFENGGPVTIDVLSNDTDEDLGDTKRVVAVNGVGLQGTVAIAAGGTGVTYSVGGAFQSLGVGATATETFTYTMQDSGGAQSTANVTITITGANDTPVAVANSAITYEDGGPITIDVLANDIDIDQGDTKTIIAFNPAGLRGSVTIAPSGTSLVYAVVSEFQNLRSGATATETFTYTIIDSTGAQSTANVTVTINGVNDAPLAVANTLTVTEDAASTSITVLANDVDPDQGDTKRIVSIDATGLLGQATIATSGTSILYSPGTAFQHLVAGQVATEVFSYTMTDGAGAVSTSTVTVLINGLTDGPRAMPDAAFAAEDGGTITIDVLANDIHDLNPSEVLSLAAIDGAGSPATIELILIYGVGVGFINPGFPATQGSISIAADGRSVNYTPLQSLKAGESFTDFFRYTARDSAGRVSTAIASISVTGANDAPVAVSDTRSIVWNAAPMTWDLLANDTDADAGDTKRILSIDSSSLLGSVTLSPTGTNVTYSTNDAFATLPFGQIATETFQYTIVDAAGLQSTATATVTITGANHAPNAMNDTAIAHENGASVSIDILANDTDTDTPFGDSIQIIDLLTAGISGTVSLSADGQSLNYAVGTAFQQLAAGTTTTEQFSYVIADSLGVLSTAAVTVTIHGANDAPVAIANSISVSEDAAPTTIAVLANDTDVDAGDTRLVVSVNTTGLLGNVAISPGGAGVIYTVASAHQTLNAGQSATETFTYTMSDSVGAESTATVTVTIVGANEPVIYVTPPPPPAGAIVGTAGDDVLIATELADIVYGQAGDDELHGAGGADILFGGNDRDDIDGGNGNDVINGGSDRDDLTGGEGADVFKYYLASESTSTAFDKIKDFDASEGDQIDLSLIDANTVVGDNNSFVISPSFSRIAGQLVITLSAAGIYQVRGDVNGDAVADLVIEVRSDRALTESDFLL